jgi:hypothetical protein
MRPNPANYFDQKQMFLGQLPRQIRTSAPSVNGCGAHLAPSPLCGDANTKAESQGHYIGVGELMRVTRKSLKELVDVAGIEPATPCLQSRCSPS